MKTTKPHGNEFFRGLKNFYTIIGAITQLVYICYLAYALKNYDEHFTANAILLALSIVYFIFFLIMHRKNGRLARSTKRTVRHAYRFSKLIMNFVNLFITVQAMILTSKNFNIFSIVFVLIMFSSLSGKILLEIILFAIERRITRTVNKVNRGFEKIKMRAKPSEPDEQISTEQ